MCEAFEAQQRGGGVPYSVTSTFPSSTGLFGHDSHHDAPMYHKVKDFYDYVKMNEQTLHDLITDGKAIIFHSQTPDLIGNLNGWIYGIVMKNTYHRKWIEITFKDEKWDYEDSRNQPYMKVGLQKKDLDNINNVTKISHDDYFEAHKNSDYTARHWSR